MFVVVEAAVLVEAKWQGYCHTVWVCQAPESVQMKRVMARQLTEVRLSSACDVSSYSLLCLNLSCPAHSAHTLTKPTYLHWQDGST